MKKERGDETQFTTKIGGKSSLGPSYFALYNFHSQLHSPYLSQNWPFSPPNRRTLRITLLSHDFLFCGNLRNLRNVNVPTANGRVYFRALLQGHA